MWSLFMYILCLGTDIQENSQKFLQEFQYDFPSTENTAQELA